MRLSKTLEVIICLLVLPVFKGKAQPIPVELMMGNNYGTINLVFSKKFSPDSRFGFFHLSTIQFDYNEEDKNSFILQDALFVETIKNVRLSGGVSYNHGGLEPNVGLQYIYATDNFMFLCSPKINIESEPAYNVISILQYRTPLNDKLTIFTKLQLLNVFDESGNIRSYQWMRLGLDTNGIVFGFAANLDEYGPSPKVEGNFGIFILKEIF